MLAKCISPAGDHKFLHFDSCVSKIDEMYKTILQGNPTGRRKRRNAGAGAVNFIFFILFLYLVCRYSIKFEILRLYRSFPV